MQIPTTLPDALKRPEILMLNTSIFTSSLLRLTVRGTTWTKSTVFTCCLILRSYISPHNTWSVPHIGIQRPFNNGRPRIQRSVPCGSRLVYGTVDDLTGSDGIYGNARWYSD